MVMVWGIFVAFGATIAACF
ncbi:hypothetical protein ACFOEE_00105 [Pseudoalteromonas fenneropenaei]|uniref:Uncharacterized protein n=1 Tax=Pseudoalteromonas fenneropenaei TaxID=1737459 RepID=A0ABV7CEH6_9GAMM